MPQVVLACTADADEGLGGTGCLYTGPTAITLNSDGTMTVVSPGTLSNSSTSVVSSAACLGASKPLPASGVIYVQNVPSGATDPNYTAACRTATQLEGVSTINHPLGYPQRYDVGTFGCLDCGVVARHASPGR